jgi:hypothetical protein
MLEREIKKKKKKIIQAKCDVTTMFLFWVADWAQRLKNAKL